MKGVVFTEFLEMVEDKFGADMVDDIIDASNVPSGGAYTAVGTYPHEEIIALVVALNKATEIPVNALVYTFGHHLFGRFAAQYGIFFENVYTAFDFLETIERHIHVEVRKLYPDAELPRFECSRNADNQLIMVYRSERAMSDLAHGLIVGCAEHYQENIQVNQQFLDNENGNVVRFTLTKI